MHVASAPDVTSLDAGAVAADSVDEATCTFVLNVEEDICTNEAASGAHARNAAPDSDPSWSAECLGPPLHFLPQDIELSKLQQFRADYQAFRTGCAAGARGEIGWLAGIDESAPLFRGSSEPQQPACLRHGRVSLINLKLSASDVAICATAEAPLHRESWSRQSSQSADDSDQVSVRFEGASSPRSPRSPPSPSGPCRALAAAAPLLPPQHRQAMLFGMAAQQGVGLLVHAVVSLVCLLPCMLTPTLAVWQRLAAPVVYACALVAHSASDAAGGLGHTLRMSSVIRDGCLPEWFPRLAAACYALLALLLALSNSYDTRELGGKVRISWRGQSLHRYDYSCWGNGAEDVAECVLVRHAALTTLVTFYMCLLAAAACDRNVKDADLVGRHRESLLELFPSEAACLFDYIEGTVARYEALCSSSPWYNAQAVSLSLAWTLLSYTLYAGLLADSKSLLAWATFLAAAGCTYTLLYTLLRHVLLRVLLYLQAVNARVAALACCDEEEVLPFSSAHAIYVWFSVRRNVQAQNEVVYQLVKPIMVVSMSCAAACSCWVATELSHRGRSIFALASRGGGSLLAVASAGVTCIFTSFFLGALLDIGRFEEEHAKQLRTAHCRLERAKWWSIASGRQRQVRGPCQPDNQIVGACAMIGKVLVVLEMYDKRPSIFGIEFGSKSFKLVYAALLSNAWYLLIWGVLMPFVSRGEES